MAAAGLGKTTCIDRQKQLIVINPTALKLFRCPVGQALGRMLAAAQRKALESQRRRSQKMQAVGTLAGTANVGNGILSAPLGNVELSQGDAQLDSAVATRLTEIDKAGSRARELVRQRLRFSRSQSSPRVSLHLADVIIETRRLLKSPCHVR